MTIPDISKATEVANVLKNINLDLLQLSKKLNLSLDNLEQFKTVGKKLQSVEKEFEKFKGKGVQQGEELNKLLKEFKKAKEKIQEADKLAKGAKKATDQIEKIQKLLFAKIPDKYGGGILDKASAVGGILGIFAAIGFVFLVKLQEFVTGQIFDNLDSFNEELTKANTIATNNGLKLKNFDTKLQKFEKELDANAKDYYRLNKQQEATSKSVVEAKKQSNDALYETREGRKIVTGLAEAARKLANDALSEARTNKQNLEVQVTALKTSFDAKIQSINAQITSFTSKAGDGFQTAVNDTIAKIQASLSSTQAQVAAIKPQTPVDTNAIVARAVNEAKAVVAPLQIVTDARLSAAQAQISTLSGAVSALGSAVGSASRSANKAEGKADLALALNKTETQRLDEAFKKSVEDNNKALKIRDLSQSELSKEFDQKIAEFSKDADISSKIAQGNTALAEQRWQQTLALQEQWLKDSYKTTKIVAEFQTTALNSFGNIDVQIKDVTNKSQQAITNVENDLQQQISESEERTDDKIDKLKTTSDKSLDTLAKELEQQRNDFERVADENAKIAQGDTKLAEQKWNTTIKELEKTFDRKQNDTKEKLDERIDQETVDRKREDKSITTGFGEQIKNIQQQIDNPTNTSAEVEQLRRDLEKVKQDLTTIKPNVNDLQKRTEEQEKVNALALPKLDQIVGILGLIPARAATAIRPDIPTLPEITAATGTAICNSTNGGCLGRSLDNTANNINGNTANLVNAGLNGLNLGANAALLAGQQTILQRLGNQLPGGIGGKLSRFADWMHLDRVLNIMILAATIHNALMLSNDIGQTFVGIINNVLQLIGLKKEDGSTFDIGSVISSSVENLIKGAIGADNYIELKESWAKANRIYQATANVLNSFLNLSQTILQASELIAAYTGKIGNALRKGGVILESAYGWMNPQPKFNRVTKFLEGLQSGASTIQMVTQAPLDIVNATTEFTTASTEFVKAIKEDDKPENKATPTPEPDELKAKETQSMADSQPLNFDFSDLFDGED
jgi:hypothetical protein